METITIHPKNKEQFTVIEAFLKALKIPFKKDNPEFIKKNIAGR